MVAARRNSQLKAFETSILEALDQVEQATSKLFKLEDILEAVCQNILAQGFDFANISLISREHNIIEGVCGSGSGVEWATMPKHYLEPDPQLRDIQADIVQTQQTEVISGWDKRFDHWIYHEYGHEKLVRVFTPIVLVQDYNGRVIKNWFERCKWQKISPEFEESRVRQHEVYQLRLAPDLQPEGRNPEVIVIGTVEAGYSSPERRIEEKILSRLLDYIARQSLDIWQAQLPRVLETIAEKAKQILDADAATLHFLYEPNLEQGRYIYEVFSHGIGKQFLKTCPPRHNGLGRQAILEKKYKFIPDLSQGHDKLEMAKLNPQAFSAGIKAMAAFPLQVENKEGILYVLFRRTYILSTRKLRLVELFVRRWAVDAIWHTIRIEQMRNEVRQLAALYSVTQSLGRIPEDNLLRHIAWNILNVLGADVVNIYEYIQTERQFPTPPKIAGRLRQEQKMQDEMIGENLPFLLIQRGENVYVPQLQRESIFQNSAFTHREKIHSVAGVLLEVDKDIVGVMFINYRRPHSFSEDEKKMIETLASSAAIAIKNQRWEVQAAQIQIELDARSLENCADVEAIRQAHRSLSNGELESPVRTLLNIFSRISEGVDAALNQASTYNQRLALRSVTDRLDGYLQEFNRTSKKYTINFYPIAKSWREIIAIYAEELAKAAELRQEIDSPYIIGVPLTQEQEIFTGRNDIGIRIEQLLLDRRRPPLLLYGQRRMGKTSLLNNLGKLLPNTIIPMFVDLQGAPSSASDHAGFLYNLAREMVKSAKKQGVTLPSLTRESLNSDPFTTFDEWLDTVEQTLEQNTALLMLDEFEVLDSAITKGRFDEQDVLGMLRHLIQHRPRFKVLLAGSHTIAEYQRWASYLINVQVVYISYLKEAEARQLIERPVKDFTLRYEPDAVERVLQLTRCHPFLVQLLCAEIIALKNEQDPSMRRLATLADVEAAIPEAFKSGGFFFADIQNNQVDENGRAILRFIAAQGEGAIALHHTLSQQFPHATTTRKLLLQRELIEEVGDGDRFQVELIRRWFILEQ
ncbi:MAG: GAF domain-containing protein [Aulosira sp. ZfuVER01]|nr:GAF domain-containing protein [Aulosira sp. ZfuVER01]MDZ7996403.1 GAF domain-containing protein [Aulosira sp. DedVER01a]MDZ8054092.1 GAF domain-containing protein [Aulosira sp. ZfuCHP01]